MTNLTLQLSLIYLILLVLAVMPAVLLFTENKKRSLISFAATAGLAVAAYFFIGAIIEFGFQNIALFNALIWWLHGKLPHVVNHLNSVTMLLTLIAASAISWTMLFALKAQKTAGNIIRGAEIKSFNCLKKQVEKAGIPKKPLKIGGIPIPEWLETRSYLIVGALGVGKTLIILLFVWLAKKRGDKVIVTDACGDIMCRTKSKNDYIFSLTDGRSIDLSPFADIDNNNKEVDIPAVAKALNCPDESHGSGDNSYFYGQSELAIECYIEALWDAGKRTNKDLLYYAVYASDQEKRELLKDTKLKSLLSAGNERPYSTVMSMVSQSLAWLEYCNPDAGSDSFGPKKYVMDIENQPNLFLTYDDLTANKAAPALKYVNQMAINAALTLPPSNSRRIHFVIDELASCGKFDSLDTGVSRGRKYGLSFVLGLQNNSQLYAKYGEHRANSILGCVGHRVILRSPDCVTGEYLSRTIGDVEIEDNKVSVNSYNNSKTTQFSQKTHRAVLASELANLPDRHGFLNIAGFGWAKIIVPNIYSKLPVKVKAFMSKSDVKKAKENLAKQADKQPSRKPGQSSQRTPNKATRQVPQRSKIAQKPVAKTKSNKPLDEV